MLGEILLNGFDILDITDWSETESKTINHRETWPQTPVFRLHMKNVPPQKVMTNVLSATDSKLVVQKNNKDLIQW